MDENNNNVNLFNIGITPPNGQLILNDSNYCCTDCSSLIEILEINENNNIIKFNCSNKNNLHQKSIDIKQYLEKRKQNKIKNNQINRDICDEHGQKFKAYCFECNKHICEICLSGGIHIGHEKINIIEIAPFQEEIQIFDKLKEYFEKEIDILLRENIYRRNQLSDLSKSKKDEIVLNEIKNKKMKDLKNQEEMEIKNINERYSKALKLLEDDYIKKRKKLKSNYKYMYNKIINKFKLKVDLLFHNIQMIRENFNNKIKEYENKIENNIIKSNNINNIKFLNEVILNTYNEYPQNIFNIINISQIIMNYNEKNMNIRNKVILNILNDDYNNKIKLISTKVQSFHELFTKKILPIKIFMAKEDNFEKKNKISKNNDRFNYHQRSLYNDKLKIADYNDQIQKEFINQNKRYNNINSFNFSSTQHNEKKNINKFEDLFDPIFFICRKKHDFNFNKINNDQYQILRKEYFKYKKEKKENDLIICFDKYFLSNISNIFKRKDIQAKYINIIKYNIEAILDCFELNKNRYNRYYSNDRRLRTSSAHKIWK